MTSRESIVEFYLAKFREGRCDDAFHCLIETDPAIIPDLINAYEGTDDISTKVFLIEVVSEFRLETSLYFFRHALRQEDPKIWRSALDGMAMAESSEAVEAMRHVLASVTDADKRAWIEEAITDTGAALGKKANS